jgi:hypothetical protein
MLLRRDVSKLVICGQGPPPPNPQVVERFQQVISQLFQQVCRHRYDALLTMHVLEYCACLEPTITHICILSLRCAFSQPVTRIMSPFIDSYPQKLGNTAL